MAFFSWDESAFLVKYNHMAESKKEELKEYHLSVVLKFYPYNRLLASSHALRACGEAFFFLAKKKSCVFILRI